MGAGIDVEGRTWNIPTALAAGWTDAGSGTRSGTAAGDSCTGNNSNLIDLARYRINPGPENRGTF
jgi:hypothetical protein